MKDLLKSTVFVTKKFIDFAFLQIKVNKTKLYCGQTITWNNVFQGLHIVSA